MVRVENVFLTAIAWPTNNGGKTIWETSRISLDGFANSGHAFGWPSTDLVGHLIERGLSSTSNKVSCGEEM